MPQIFKMLIYFICYLAFNVIYQVWYGFEVFNINSQHAVFYTVGKNAFINVIKAPENESFLALWESWHLHCVSM